MKALCSGARRLALLLVGFASTLAPAFGQGDAGDTGETQEAPIEEQIQGEVYDSPRAVMRRFLEAMEARDVEAAAQLFDTSDLFEADGEEAIQAAEDLYEALNRTTRVELEAFPNVPMLGPRKHFRWARNPHGRRDITIVVDFTKQADGWWISGATRRGAADMRADVAGLPFPEELLRDMPLFERWRYRIREALPETLLDKSFLIENWQWVALGALIFLAVLLDRIARFLVGRVLVALVGERLEADVILRFERPVGLIVGANVFGAFLALVGLRGTVESPLILAVSFVATIAGVWAAYSLVDVLCGYLERRAARTVNKFDDMLVPLVRRTLKIFVLVVGLVFLASRWTEDLWGVVAGLGIGSLAVGFAARDSIENLFGTFTVLLDKPFQIGDWIIAGSLEGTVESVGFRSTRIRTFYDSLITVPNRTFISQDVDNMGERRYRRIRTTLGVTYDTPPEKLEAFCEGVRELIRAHPYTRKDYYHVYLNGFGASALDVMLYCFVRTPDWGTELREKHRLFADILRLAEELGVDFAFPTQTLHMAKPEDLVHSDRPADDPAGLRRGREVAGTVLERSLGRFEGRIPPPVKTRTGPVGSGDGEAGGE